jgi:elongation factor G
MACFPAVETVVVCVDPVRGIEPTTRRLMQIAEERNLPRMIVVTKIDHADIDVEATTAQIRETFGTMCLPVNLPTKGGADVINVFEHDGSDAAGDETDFSSVHEAHKQIVEQVIEVDEELTLQYLEKGEGFDPDKLHDAFEKALRESHLVPICFCSAKTGAGVRGPDARVRVAAAQPLGGAIRRTFLLKRGGRLGEDQAVPSPGRTRARRYWRTSSRSSSDKHVGKLGIFRVHQGTIKAKSELFIDADKKPIRIGHLMQRQGKDATEVEALGPGDLGMVAKIEEVRFNAVLHDTHELDHIRLKPLPMPRPMFGLAVELKNHADEAKFSAAIAKLTAEDPTLVCDRIAATHQTVLRGLGELHLRVVLEKLHQGYGVQVMTSTPKVAYKETIGARADGHYRHKKQTGGSGQFGEVYLRVEPLPADHPDGFEFTSEVVGGTVPRQYWPAVEKGVRQALSGGAVAGYPMTGIRCVLYDGKYHDVDSKEIAFITAGRKAFIEAVSKAKPKLLEPYAKVEITIPSKYMGDVAGHLSTKRGRVQDTQMASGDICIVTAIAPLGELQNYSNELKSMTAGSGSYAMDYSHDEATPGNIQQQLVAAFKPHPEEE